MGRNLFWTRIGVLSILTIALGGATANRLHISSVSAATTLLSHNFRPAGMHAAVIAVGDGELTVTGAVSPKNNAYFGEEDITFTATQPITTMHVEINMQESPTLQYAGLYSSFPDGSVSANHTVTTSGIVYTYDVLAGHPLLAGTYVVGAEYSAANKLHSAANDTYSVAINSGSTMTVASGSYGPTPTVMPTATIRPAATRTPTATSTSTSTSTATATDVPTSTASVTSMPTATATTVSTRIPVSKVLAFRKIAVRRVLNIGIATRTFQVRNGGYLSVSVHTAAAATVAFRIVTESNMMAHGMGRTTFVVLGTASAKATSHGIATVRLHLADTTQTHATLQIAATLAGKVVRSSRQVVITPKK